MNPASNNPNPCKTIQPLDLIKKKMIRFKKHDVAYEITKGIFLGGLTTLILNPALYALNMSMSREKIIWKQCMKGVFLSGSTVVPQTMLQVSIFKLMKKLISPTEKIEDLSLPQKIFCSMFAGGISGASSASLEMVLLLYQKSEEKTIRKIVREAYSLGGFFRLNTGAIGVIGREMIWTPAYLVVAPAVSNVYAVFISNQNIRDFAGAATTGAITGFFTHAPNFLRVQKQKDALMPGTPRSYTQIILEVGLRGLYADVKLRMAITSMACVLMMTGNRLVSYIEKKAGE